MPGSLTLRPIEANLTRDTVNIGKMSPYCAFQIDEDTVSTSVCKNGGKHPHWEDVCTISASKNDKSLLQVHVIDNETLLKDNHIGSFSIDLKDIKSAKPVSRWYPIYYNEKQAGEILLEAAFVNQENTVKSTAVKEEAALARAAITQKAVEQIKINQRIAEEAKIAQKTVEQAKITQKAVDQANIIVDHSEKKFYHEQRQIIEPHTFIKEVDYVDTVPVMQRVEMMEPVKVVKDVEYTKLVSVMKKVEIVEPQVIKKMIEVIEPRVVTKTIQVVENVLVMKEVEIVESRTIVKEIETFEPQTFKKQVEVTEYVPVMREVQVTEPVHLKKTVEYIEPIITTKIITKEIREDVIIGEETKTTVGPATVRDVEHSKTAVIAAETVVATATVVVPETTKTTISSDAAIVVEETKTTIIPASVEVTETITVEDHSSDKKSKKQKQAEKKLKH